MPRKAKTSSTIPAAVWLGTSAEHLVATEGPSGSATDRIEAVWQKLQGSLETQCAYLSTSAQSRDDELVKRLDECLSRHVTSQDNSAKTLDDLIAAQRAQWTCIADALTRHLEVLREEPAQHQKRRHFESAAPSATSRLATEFEGTPAPSESQALVASGTWEEASPPLVELPAAVPDPVKEHSETSTAKTMNARIEERCHKQRREAEESDEFEMNEQAAYEQAKAKAERLLMLRACGLSKIGPEKIHWRTQLHKRLESWWAEGLCAFVIFTNCIIIGVETNVVAETGSQKSPEIFTVLDTCYTIFFFLELLVRLGAYGVSFFWGTSLLWNYLDMLIVLPSMVQLLVSTIWHYEAEIGGSMTVVRVLRITRVFRVIRVVKVMKFVRSLRQLVESIMFTMKSLAWSMLLLVAIIYVFAIMFTDASWAYIVDNPSSTLNAELTPNWGNLHISMHTLFRAVSGGSDWGGIAASLGDVHWAWLYLFSAYIAFCMFAVLNVMTGIFCQVAVESARNDPQFLMQSLVAERERQTDLIRNLFRIFDREKRGFIALTELEDKFNDETAQGMMVLLEIYPESGWSLFRKLDEDNDGRLYEDEFVNGIFKLKGVAKSWDIEALLQAQKQLKRAIETQSRSLLEAAERAKQTAELT
mmetsp:Transcript_8307/g.19538  ORF Transcript_8307/g.19538 Transcript_8307/m.19538 type:complete len:644 (-) Transcript_8307:194-2125(-)